MSDYWADGVLVRFANPKNTQSCSFENHFFGGRGQFNVVLSARLDMVAFEISMTWLGYAAVLSLNHTAASEIRS